MSRSGESRRQTSSQDSACSWLTLAGMAHGAVSREWPAGGRGVRETGPGRGPRARVGAHRVPRLLDPPAVPTIAEFNTLPVPGLGYWPSELVAEADVFTGAMVSRGAVWLFASSRNRRAEIISLDVILPEMRRKIRESTGGTTTIAGWGEYVPPIGPVMYEDTPILLILLPVRVDDLLRSQVLGVCVAFGWETEQQEVLALANTTSVRLPTGLLLDSMKPRQGVPPHAGINPAPVPEPRFESCSDGVFPSLTRPDRPDNRGGPQWRT